MAEVAIPVARVLVPAPGVDVSLDAGLPQWLVRIRGIAVRHVEEPGRGVLELAREAWRHVWIVRCRPREAITIRVRDFDAAALEEYSLHGSVERPPERIVVDTEREGAADPVDREHIITG